MEKSNFIENMASNRVTFLKVSLLVLLALAMVKCSFKKGDESGENPERISETSAVPHEFIGEVQMESEIHSYSVNLKWNVPEYCQAIIHKQEVMSSLAQAVDLGENTRTFQDLEIKDGKKYIYTLSCRSGSTLKVLKSINLKIPQDLTLAGKIALSNVARLTLNSGTRTYSGEFGRVKMNEDLRLNIKDNSLKLTTKFLKAEPSAEIYTFTQEDRAQNGAKGRDGGKVEIFADDGAGNLSIILRGEGGGDGLNGIEFDETLISGPAGDNGTDDVYQRGAPGSMELCMDANLQKVKCRSFITCYTEGTNGKNGGQGATGRNGSDGSPGGKSGTAKLEIKSKNFQSAIHVYQSSGGGGGAGAKGGLGGLGGMPGKQYSPEQIFDSMGGLANPGTPLKEFSIKACSTTPLKNGDAGPRGRNGDAGSSGASGEAQKSFIFNPATQQMEEI